MKPYKQIIFDFDGVILDSMPVRDKGFEIVLSDYPRAEVDQLMDYHRNNGGLSRYVKFRYFFEKIRGETISDEQVQQLAEQFSVVMRDELTNPNLLIQETMDFVRGQQGKTPLHVASGSDQNELRYLSKELGIDSNFVSIHGSPTPKTDLVNLILTENGYHPDDTLLIGDSVNDWQAADANQVRFWGYNNPLLAKYGEGYLTTYAPLSIKKDV